MKQFVTRFVLLAVALCVYGQALAYDCVVGDVCYNLDKAANTAAVASYVESPSDGKGAIAIPEAISYEGANYTVTSIEKSAFRSCEWLTSVVIPATVTSIESSTFYGCANLVSVTLPESLTEIRSATFYNCINLASVTIPDKVTYIGSGAFNNCSGLTSIAIPGSVETIYSGAFAECSGLTSVTIPGSVTSIGVGAFSRITGLATISVDKDNKIYDSRDDCNAIIETATNKLISGCKNTIIPDNVTAIGDEAFRGSVGLTSIELPGSVITIGDYAFSFCEGLTSVTIPGSVRTIGVYAFRGCTAVREIISLATIPPTCDNRALYDVNKSICKLLVAKESIERYKAAYQWEDFVNIAEYDSVDDITVDADDADTLYEVYNLQGAKVGAGLRRVDMSNALPRGVYILVSPNGTRKVRI